MWKSVAANGLTFLILALMAVAGLIAWGQNQYRAEGPLETAICLRVESGSNMRRVAANLHEQGAITSQSIFRVGADYADKSALLKAGSFLIPEGASMEEIVDIVTRGGASTCGTEVVYRIGVATQEIAVRSLDPATQRFETLAEFDPATDAVAPEYVEVRNAADTRYRDRARRGGDELAGGRGAEACGLPDGRGGGGARRRGRWRPRATRWWPGRRGPTWSARMAALQERRLEEVWANRDEGLPIETPEEALILASIIEKETSVFPRSGGRWRASS
jgi:UPF0755 protein